MAVAGIGSRQTAWQGSAPVNPRPTKGLRPEDVTLQVLDGIGGLQFVTNKGNPAGISAKEARGGAANPTGFVPVIEGAQYRLVNEKGKNKIVYSGIGAEGLSNVYALAQDLSASKGKKANWAVEMLEPGTDSWRRVADDDPAKGALETIGKVVGTALPLATMVIPGFQALSPILKVATAAGLGGLGSALAGRDPLKGAVMGGLGAAGGQFLGKAFEAGGALGTNLAPNLASAVGTGLGTTAGGLATGQNLKGALLGGVTAGGLSYLGGELMKPGGLLGAKVEPGITPTGGGGTAGIGSYGGDIVVIGGRPIGLSGAAGAVGGLAGDALSKAISDYKSPYDLEGSLYDEPAIEVRARQAANDIMNGAGGLQLNAAGYTDAEIARAYEIADEMAIVSEGQRPTTPPSVPVAGISGSEIPEAIGTEDIVAVGQKEPTIVPPNFGIDAATQQAIDEAAKQTPEEDKGLSTSDYIRLGLLAPTVLGGIGNLLGIGGGGGGGTITRGTSPLNYTPLARTQVGATQPGQAGAPGFDVFTYGQDIPGAQRGEFTFFNPYSIGAAPQTSTPTIVIPAAAAPALAEGGEVDDDMVKHLMEYQKGGGHQGPGPVKGVGSGQEDLIPAWLSDGEYVWSAQDVADLGDGSTDEGVRRLDKMRQMVRKQAGRKDVKKIAKPQKGLDKMLKAVGGPV